MAARFVIGISCALMALLSGTHPDFSGYWQLDKEKSKVSSNTATMWMKVEQSEANIVVNVRTFSTNGREENQTHVYVVGVKDNSNFMHGAPMKSDVEWNGDALEFRQLAMFGKDPLRMDETWTLSADGQTLTFRETSQFASEAQRESLMVFTRKTAKDWPEDTSQQPVEKQFKNIQVLTGKLSS